MNWKNQISLGNEISFTVGLSVITLLIGLIGSNFFLVMIGLLFLLFSYTNQLYLKRVANRLTVSIDKDLIKLFKNEQDTFSISFNQNGIYPILGARVRMTIDSVLQFEHERKMINHEQNEIEFPLSLLGRQSASIHLPFQAVERGVAKVRTLEIRIPHLFGFGDVYLKYDQPLPFETVVYSSPKTIGGINRIVPKNLGEYPMKQSYFEDMSALVGARSYVSTDPFNRVHWKASAKTNTLQTRIYERTSQYSWSIFVNVREGKLEDLLSGLTYLLEYATIKNIPFELFVNVRKAGRIPFVHHPLGTGREHLQKALEMIARLSKHSVIVPFSKMVFSAKRQFQLSPYVIFCGNEEEDLGEILLRFRKNGVVCYQLHERDGSVLLSNYSLSNRKVDYDAI
ncbi:DUF58 domain-containing protein [Litchfieldia salsa]|uniref:Uncharacterized conserved protein, DUF58 family, contains vWF domain n=1 Tax=Litchfieldia salsa TaxID=930152 RepID=A0A1H0RNS2_9BACI|nr:DUF58 domain-containing protein [Litchfieldia salsa]SDP31050.1 Uncharacterized conserved protein, DUF58 family, contains vWF domain [Litchfieldia salsa]